MNWVVELREAFAQLRARHPVRVAFADRGDTLGEVGREFNALAEDWEQLPAGTLTREQAHTLRNRLAGILAALHLLRATGRLTPQEQVALGAILEQAKQLDAELRRPSHLTSP